MNCQKCEQPHRSESICKLVQRAFPLSAEGEGTRDVRQRGSQKSWKKTCWQKSSGYGQRWIT